MMRKAIDRRAVLRGMLQGCAVTVGIPLLECLLDGNGSALASGQPIPTRFGTWFWGLGTQKDLSTPTKVGADFDLRGELVPLAKVKQHLNYFSSFTTPTDGRPNFVHHTGAGILRCGQAPTDRQTLPSETVDVTVSDVIGGASRFRSLEMTATGDRAHSYSARGPNAVNPPEISPIEFYQRVYGPEFQDPNSPDFKPNPELMLRQSVLSAVLEESASLKNDLGAADKARLDEYFTSLRGMEKRLELQLQKPPPAPQCYVPEKPKGIAEGMDWQIVSQRHNAMTDILVAALACNQTRVFNMVYSWAAAGTIKEGVSTTHHIITHEESKDDHGSQVQHEWFVLRAMESWAYFVEKLASVKEGDGTLLDNTLVYAHSEHDTAQMHSLDGIPMMTAGRAGGRLQAGIHFDGKMQQPASRVVLALMHAMDVRPKDWGFGSLKTAQPIDGLLI
jgi:hypothetical protein